jgi:predicted site-specific integrase-resolvase
MVHVMQNVSLLSSADTARVLGIHQTTVSDWVKAGRIKPVQKMPGLRGAYLFHPTEVERVRRIVAPSAAS